MHYRKYAFKVHEGQDHNGIGFVFSKNDPFSGIDLDICVGNNRSIDKWAQEIIADLRTYTEYSPKVGIRLITQGKFPGTARKIGNTKCLALAVS